LAIPDTVPGPVRIELPVVIVTGNDPEAWCGSPSVQLALCPAFNLAAEQLSVPSWAPLKDAEVADPFPFGGPVVIGLACAGGVRVRTKDCAVPLKDAVIWAVWLDVILATVAVKVPVTWPAGMDTLAGTVTLVLLLDRVTTMTEEGEEDANVTVQMADPGVATAPGEQTKDERWADPVKLMAADSCWPLSVAVTLAVWAVVMVPVVAAKVVLAWPAGMVTLKGTARAVVVLPIATTTGLAAAWFSDMVQVLEALLPRVAGAQDSVLSLAGAVRVRTKDCEPRLNDAVIWAVWLDVRLATVAVKVPVLWPAGIDTLAGTVTLVLLLDRATLAPPRGAGAVKVMVQLADPGAATVPGEQFKDEGVTATVKVMAADICWVLSVAVTVAVWAVLMVPVVAAKVTLVWPAGMVTLKGTVRAVVVLPIATTTGLAGAWFSDTVQVLEALLPKVAGAQDSVLSFAGAVRVRTKDCEPPLKDAVIWAVWLDVILATVAVKVPVLWPAGMVTLAGTVTLVLLLDRVTLAPPRGAGADKVTVQLADPGAATVAGEQFKDEGVTVTVKLMVADSCWPLSVAVTLAVWAVLMVPVVAAKVVLAWPAGMVTLAGTDRAGALLPIATTTALVAAWLSVTVQVLEALLPSVAGAQDSVLSFAGAVRVSVTVFAVPLPVPSELFVAAPSVTATVPLPAVTTAVWSEPTKAPVAVNTALVWPEATVTLDGSVKFTLLLERGTVNPPDCAAEFRVTVQRVFPGVLIVKGEQLTVETATDVGSEIEPEPPLAGIDEPIRVEATTAVIWIGIVVVEGFDAIWKVAVATVPFAIVVLSTPNTRQTFPPHVTDLPAANAALPVTTVTLVISEE
jgi:hypothetical protein